MREDMLASYLLQIYKKEDLEIMVIHNSISAEDSRQMYKKALFDLENNFPINEANKECHHSLKESFLTNLVKIQDIIISQS